MKRVVILALALVAACRRDAPDVARDDPPKRAKPASTPAMSALTIDMPHASPHTSTDEVTVVLSVAIDAAGKVMLNGLPAADADITPTARKALATAPELRAIVVADRSVAYGRLIEVVDKVRLAGVTRIAFGVAPSP
jgi:biopolymer transport protein ExbD